MQAGASYSFEWTNDPIFADGKRVLASTQLDFNASNYANNKITFWFNVKFDNVMFTQKFIDDNKENYWRAVVAHEHAHAQQFLDLAQNASATLLSSGLTGDELDLRFQDIMTEARNRWYLLNADEGHSDANNGAKAFLDEKYWKYLSTTPKF